MFPQVRKIILIVQYWLVPGMDSSIIYISKIVSFRIKLI